MTHQRKCVVCGDWFPEDRRVKGAPAGVCSTGCNRERLRARAQDRAARRRVPPRAPMRLLSPSSRDWDDAREKVAAEGKCRVCGREPGHGVRLEAAHIVPRALGGTDDPRCIVPLCRSAATPAGGCHPAYDANVLDLEPYLTVGEQAYAVTLTGSLSAALRVIRGTREVAA